MSEVRVNKLSPRSGTTVTLGDSGDTITIPSGVTLANSGTFTNFQSTGIDDNATSTAITINSSQNVGIGTTSPSSKLQINNTGSSTVDAITLQWEHLSVTTSIEQRIKWSFGDDVDTNSFADAGYIGVGKEGSWQSGSVRDSYLSFGTTLDAVLGERMRIDSSGNVMVGKTSLTSSTVGIEARDGGFLLATRSGGNPLMLNRTTSDGTILDFRKDNSTVGTIGAYGGRTILASGNTGLRLDGTADAIVPRTSTNTLRTNTIDLGDTANTFKDLYLGGGVFLGGTGTANKLDDYEEGTWTPVYEGATSNPTITYDGFTHGVYNKVGNVVFARGYIRTDGVSGGSGNLKLAGFPFNFPAQAYGATVLIQQILSWGTAPAFTAADNNADTVNLLDSSGNNLTTSDLSASSNSNSMTILAVYQI